MLKDGHVGSEWFAEAIARQPGTRFIFEMGPCITGSLAGKRAFVTEKRGCACSKEDCSLFKKSVHRAPCLDEPSARSCSVLGGSHLSMASTKEQEQWATVLRNSTAVTVAALYNREHGWKYARAGIPRA